MVKTNSSNQPYWGVDNFCEINQSGVKESCNLTDLEWEGNELFISHSADISKLLQYGLGVIVAWKAQMAQDFPQIPFDIVLSIDKGDEDISPSVTLRFWAVRDGYHFINPVVSELEKYILNPTLMDQVNQKIEYTP